MRTLLYISLIAIAILGCKEHEKPEIKSNLKYYGFALIDVYWDDPLDNEVKSNYLDEVSPFTNMADILVTSPGDKIDLKISRMTSQEVYPYLHLHELFFEYENTDAPSGSNYKLREDFESRWKTFTQSNEELKQVIAFYLGEEPTWNGIEFAELKIASELIKGDFPNTPIMLVEAYPILDELRIPASIDWVGFDHYFIKDPAKNEDYLKELTLLKSKLRKGQNLVIIMDTHFIKEAHQDFGGITPDEMDMVADSYYELAQKEDRVVAIIGYFWLGGFDHPKALGARNMPDHVIEKYQEIGKAITD